MWPTIELRDGYLAIVVHDAIMALRNVLKLRRARRGLNRRTCSARLYMG